MVKILAFIVPATILLSAPSLGQSLVVWDFASRDGRKTDITASLTYEFEEALSEGSTYTVLERRKLDRLRAVIENEKALQDVGQITSEGSKEMRQLGVSVVVFGEVFDDIDSGDLSVTVTFQDFTGKKLLIKSVLMRRGLVLDATSRRERMVTLVEAISETDIAGDVRAKNQIDHQAARLIFRVRPEDALVYVDGKNVGLAKGLSKDLEGVVVTPGSRSIGIGRIGYKSLRRDVSIRPGDVITIEESLMPELPVSEEVGENDNDNKSGRHCVDNFSEEGGFFKGKMYKTWQSFSGIGMDVVFKRIAQSVAVNGWYNINVNEGLGVITALNQETLGGAGARSPLNIVVESGVGGEVRVEAIFTINPLQKASTASVRDGFCKILEYAEE